MYKCRIRLERCILTEMNVKSLDYTNSLDCKYGLKTDLTIKFVNNYMAICHGKKLFS
jgi:hypothetical protein